MRKLLLSLSLFSLVSIILNSCKKGKDTNKYDVPTTYTFDSVDYSGQTTRLDMITELLTEVKKGNTSGTIVSAQKLKDMYANINNQFTVAALNTSGKKLKDKTFASEQTIIESYFDLLETASQSTQPGSNGVAGIVGTRLYDANGIEYKEAIEKGLMGALIYYQISEVYLSESEIGASIAKSNRQHHWDEAFGYYGVPVDFPSNLTGIRYWGKYGNERDALLGVNATIMNAYLKGRAAINNDDNAEVTKQASVIRENLEKVLAGTVLHYINDAIDAFGDDNTRNHTLNEFTGIVRALKFNSAKKISDAQIADILNLVGTNYYNVTLPNLNAAKNSLSTIYGMDAVKDQL